MPLPDGGPKVMWPPQDTVGAYMRYAEWSAWYDGSPLALAAFYGGYGGSQLGGQSLGFFNQNLTYPEPTNMAAPLFRRFMFWSKQPSTPVTRFRMHVPMAADIAMTSADLLFSEPARITIPAAHLTTADTGAKESQDRLDELVEDSGLDTVLVEAAEVAAALGGVYLRAGWDSAHGRSPFLTAVHADSAVPEFLWGRMVAVTFWRIVHQDSGKVWRHLERHELGVVLHGLYEGTAQYLGRAVPLTESPVTADLAVDVVDGNRIETGLPDRLTAVYIPNMRPNRADRGSSLGRSDYAGVESLMDALDETYTSWMRDIRLGKGRILLNQDLLHSEGKGKGAGFDIDKEVIMLIDSDPLDRATGGITQSQFAIRTKEHSDTATDLVERIVAGAGYSGSSFGLKGEGTIKTATEIAAREQRSLVTRGKKALYWGKPLGEIIETLMMLDHELFGGPEVVESRVQFSDSVRNDPKEIAATAGLLKVAGAASTLILVKLVHPEWTEAEVAEEVTRITAEGAAKVPTVTPAVGLPTPATSDAPPADETPAP